VVREALPGKFLATEGRFPPLLPRMEIVLAEAGTDGCRLTWRMFSRNDNLIVRYALLPLAARVMDKRAKAGVAALKKRLEGDPMPGAGTTE